MLVILLLLFLFGGYLYYLFIGALGVTAGLGALIKGLFSKDKEKRKDSFLMLIIIFLILVVICMVSLFFQIQGIEINEGDIAGFIIWAIVIYVVLRNITN